MNKLRNNKNNFNKKTKSSAALYYKIKKRII
jgi:hypothetical protein